MGRKIVGEGYGDWFGNVVSLSPSGERVLAIVGYGARGMAGMDTGQVIDDSKCVSFLRVNRGLPCLFDIDTILNVVYSL